MRQRVEHEHGIDRRPRHTAIAWHIDLGTGPNNQLTIDLNDDQDNTVVLTNASFNLNGAVGEVLGAPAEWNLNGGDGNDVLDASAVTVGFTDLFGGDGDDVISPGTTGGDFLAGDGDEDTLSYATRTTATAIVNGVLAGTDLNGDGDSADVGEEGDFVLDCFEILQTGTGADTIVANGDGCGGLSVTAIPGDGDDHVVGDGNDWIDWSSSSAGMAIDIPTETAVGQGTDTWDGISNFVGSPLDDTMTVGASAPGPGVAEFFGGAGVDTVDGNAAAAGVNINLDILDPSGADDLENVVGSAFNDTLDGNDQRNQINAGAGDDFLDGQPGNDTLLGEAGNDTYFGDTGADRVSFAGSPQKVTVDLSLGFATGEGDDSFVDGIEIILGSAFNDSITGGPFGGGGTVNFLFVGKQGNDTLTGFSGNDTLKGGGGNDTLRGVGGDDTMLAAAGNDRLFGGGGTDIGKGGKGNDTCSKVEIKTSCGKNGNPASPQAGVAGKLS